MSLIWHHIDTNTKTLKLRERKTGYRKSSIKCTLFKMIDWSLELIFTCPIGWAHTLYFTETTSPTNTMNCQHVLLCCGITCRWREVIFHSLFGKKNSCSNQSKQQTDKIECLRSSFTKQEKCKKLIKNKVKKIIALLSLWSGGVESDNVHVLHCSILHGNLS